MSDAFLKVRGLSKVYPGKNGGGEHVVFEDLNLDIARGEIVCLIGPTGCGKTSLLDIILGAKEPTSGYVEIGGEIVRDIDHRRGIISQGIDLFWDLRVLDHVIHGPLIRRTTMTQAFFRTPKYRRIRRELYGHARELLKTVGLEQHLQKYPSELSGGMQQRVAIASAINFGHDVLLIDEFTSKLDQSTQEGVQIFAEAELRRSGTTAIIVTHSLVEALFIGDRVIGLSQHYEPAPGSKKRGAKVVVDIKVPGQRPRDRQSKADPENATLRHILDDLVLDEAELVKESDFLLTHPSAWRPERKAAASAKEAAR